jgi:L-lactate dehydrogenase
VWSSATYAGLPLTKVAGCTPTFQSQIFERTKGSGAEVIRRKGGAGWAVGLTIAEVIHTIAHDKRQVLPVATVQQGAYGLRGTAISVPTVVGRRGAIAHVEVELWPKELQALQASARALNETFAKVKAG